MINYDYIIESAIAQNTRIAYANCWERFLTFCICRHYCPLPATPQTVVEFLIHLATQPVRKNGKPLSIGSVAIYHSAINRKHRDEGIASPTIAPEVVNTMHGLRRLCAKPPRRVRALRENQIEAMLRHCGSSTIGLRNAAIISLGFAVALRRSEICSLRLEDLQDYQTLTDPLLPTPPQMFVTIRKSKTDQQGRGQKIALMDGERVRPITRLRLWLLQARITHGNVFCSMRRNGALRGYPLHHSDIVRIVKSYAKQIGLDPREIAGHSLRAGFVTSAAAHNARLDKIMAITRHRNPETVLQYIRDADAFASHAGAGFL